MLFDPRTFELREDRVTQLEPSGGVKAGTVTNDITYLASGVVNRIGEQVGGGSLTRNVWSPNKARQ